MRRYGKHTALANKLKAWGLLQQEINDPPVDIAALHDVATGTQFACFTSKKVQIVTQKTSSCRTGYASDNTARTATQELAKLAAGTQFTCFTSTKVQILTPETLRASPANCKKLPGPLVLFDVAFFSEGAVLLEVEEVILSGVCVSHTSTSHSMKALLGLY